MQLHQIDKNVKIIQRGVNMIDLFENITENEKNELLKQLNSFTYKFNRNEIIPKDIFFKKSQCSYILFTSTFNVSMDKYRLVFVR